MKLSLRCFLTVIALWRAGAICQAANPTPNPLIPPPQTTRPMPVVAKWEKFEAAFILPRQNGNPFDPVQNDVQVIFHGPTGRGATRAFAFWDGNGWKVRFTPTRPGRYTLTVQRNGKAARPARLTTAAFRCVGEIGSGFVRRDRGDFSRFVFDTGQGYYPVGINQAWTERGAPDYPGAFAQMRKNHLNWARVWMSFWDAKALDWAAKKPQNPPPGYLYLPAARRWDMILDEAAKNGVYVQMCLQHHGQYTNGPDANWKDNPANAVNGGFLTNPADFFTNAEARKRTRAKYRYIVARWGYSPHLLSYELFNEVQNIGETKGRFQDVVNWHKEMAAYVRSLDTNHHLVTTSNSAPGEPLAQIGLDYHQIHAYVHDPLAYFAGRGDDRARLDAPVFAAEWGPDGNDYGYGGLTAAFVHDGLWASLMTPDAGGGMMWYWEMLTKRNWWSVFGAAGAFVQNAGIASHARLSPLKPHAASSATVDLPLTPRGWEATTQFDINVTRDGQATGLGNVSSFIQGVNHREMTARPVTFHIQGPTRFVLRIGTVAKAGAEVEVRLDGQRTQSAHYAPSEADHAGGKTLTVAVPAGAHTVSLFNTGPDWYAVESVTLSKYAPALAALAKGNKNAAFFWAYNRDRRSDTPIAGTLVFPGLRDGFYTLRLWNTRRATVPPSTVTVRSLHGRLTILLPAVQKDVAGSLLRLR